ncbi:uncharacterized protein [Arachis hypogaea]|uniref:uncharacterized protein n=1 Tax=Arachis hypogaea TaxID=3818 RepID=UPI0007AF207E|nr:uncharacterized protein LOC112730320 [Arachis hypogaea]
MLAMFLYVLGGGNSNKSTKERFQHSGETISQKFEEVLQAMYKMAIDIIQPKDRDFKEDAIGVIDGTHVPVIVSTEDQIRFIGRKGIPTQNVMAKCNFDMEFTFALVGWEGTAYDRRVFLYAIGTSELNFQKPPPGKYYLVDAGYPEKIGYLGPYKGATYHLPEFRRVNGPSRYYEIYNYAHSSLRSMDIELEQEEGYGDEGEAENGVEKVGDEFLRTMGMVRNNIASSLIGEKN